MASAALLGGLLAAFGVHAENAQSDAVVISKGASVPPASHSTLTPLDERQRAAVRDAVEKSDSGQKPVAGFKGEIGEKVPKEVHLHPLPRSLVAAMPALSNYSYSKIEGHSIAIVDALSGKVIDAIPLQPASSAAAPDAAGAEQKRNDQADAQSKDRTERQMDEDGTPGKVAARGVEQKSAPDVAAVPVLQNGRLTAGGSVDAETAPAKYSAHNEALDKRPIMSGGIGLTEPEKQQVFRAVMDAASIPTETVEAAPATMLPPHVALQEWPGDMAGAIPALRGYKFVKTRDKVLLVDPPNKIVVGAIARAPG